MDITLSNSQCNSEISKLENSLKDFLKEQKLDIISLTRFIKDQHSSSESSKILEHILIKEKTGNLYLEKPNIIYVKAQGAYTKVFLKDGRNFIISKNLKNLTDVINDKKFIRTHKSYLVNMNYVSHYKTNADNYSLILKDGSNIPISVRKKREIKKCVLGLINQ